MRQRGSPVRRRTSPSGVYRGIRDIVVTPAGAGGCEIDALGGGWHRGKETTTLTAAHAIGSPAAYVARQPPNPICGALSGPDNLASTRIQPAGRAASRAPGGGRRHGPTASGACLQASRRLVLRLSSVTAFGGLML